LKRILLVILIPLLGFSYTSRAQGDLLVTPGRVVFEGNRQKQEIDLVNMGVDTTTYSISFVKKKHEGRRKFCDRGKEGFRADVSDPYLRIFPRQVTLAPGESQVIHVAMQA